MTPWYQLMGIFNCEEKFKYMKKDLFNLNKFIKRKFIEKILKRKRNKSYNQIIKQKKEY